MSILEGFTDHVFDGPEGEIAYSVAGEGPPLMLLHGFPQTRAMWHGIAPALAEDFTVVAADLRGYGDSFKPEGVEAMSFRAMARDPLALMRHLGHETFHLVGHDRGGRTAHRLALDAPEALRSLAVLDIVPTHTLLTDLSMEVATAYYHWFYLIQPAPFPEDMIAKDADTYFESAFNAWGHGSLDDFAPAALEAYRASWRRPETIHTMCNDYRAGVFVDVKHDAADLDARVTCPVLVAYGADGAMGKMYDVPATWADKATQIQAAPLPGGHFFPDTHPAETLEALRGFLKGVLSADHPRLFPIS